MDSEREMKEHQEGARECLKPRQFVMEEDQEGLDQKFQVGLMKGFLWLTMNINMVKSNGLFR